MNTSPSIDAVVDNVAGSRNPSDVEIDPVRSPTSSDTSKHSRCSSLAAAQQATEIVKSLFGNEYVTVGKVVGVYSCSVGRQSGKFYVSTVGLFFYSNLFGFEKRICVTYEEAIQIIQYRSTSLYVRTLSGDEYVFKSFQNRCAVHKVISEFYQPNSETNRAETRDSMETVNESDTNGGMASSELRPRLESNGEASIRSSDSEPDIGAALDNVSAIWDAIKSLTNDWESSVTSVKLPFDKVKDFFDIFLADDASHSLSVFHQLMGDKNVKIGSWSRDDATENAANSDESISRVIQFEHKSKVSVAQVTRNQTYRCYGECACVKNVTNIQGVPSADTFFVEDMWTLEKCEDCIVLNVKYRITFSKSTYLKSIIENRARSEAIGWYDRYIAFVKDTKDTVQTKSKALTMDESQPVNVVPNEPCLNVIDPPLRLVLLVCFILSAILVYGLRLRVIELENAMAQIESRMLELENQCLLGP